MKWKAKCITGALLATALVHQAQAQQNSPWETASLSLGAILANMNTSARVGVGGTGVEIDLEDVLGLERSQDSFRVDGLYRFGHTRRHRLDFTYYDLNREATRTLTTQIEVGGSVYPVGTSVDSTFDLTFYNVRYSYSFIQDDRVDFAASIGLHVTDIGLSVTGQGVGTRGEKTTAPLPVLGLRLDVLLAPKWYARTSVEALYLAFDDIKGSLVDAILAVEYRPWQHFSLGAGLNSVHMRLEGDEDTSVPGFDFSADFDVSFTGLLLYGKLMF